jgi:hypothetical protein
MTGVSNETMYGPSKYCSLYIAHFIGDVCMYVDLYVHLTMLFPNPSPPTMIGDIQDLHNVQISFRTMPRQGTDRYQRYILPLDIHFTLFFVDLLTNFVFSGAGDELVAIMTTAQNHLYGGCDVIDKDHKTLSGYIGNQRPVVCCHPSIISQVFKHI